MKNRIYQEIESSVTDNKVLLMVALGVLSVNSSNAERYIEKPTTQSNFPGIFHKSNSTRPIYEDKYSLTKLLINKEILLNLKNLKSNWNQYNGRSIDRSIIEKTEEFISNIDFQPQIFPTGGGTIQIEFYKDEENLVEMEILDDIIEIYKVQNGVEFEGNISFDEAKTLISEFYA